MKRQLPCFRFGVASLRAIIFILPLLLSSCKFDHTTLQTQVPGALPVRVSVKKFVLANRSQKYGSGLVPDNGPLLIDLLDHFDTWTSYSPEESLRGLVQELASLSYNASVSIIDKQYQFGDSLNLTQPLDWKTVARLVGDDENTALVVMEMYYAKCNISTTKDVNKKDGVREVRFDASAETTVKTVWRVYDLENHSISELYYCTKTETNSSYGKESRDDAKQALPPYETTVKELSYAAGKNVAHSLFPETVTLARKFYRGTPNLPMLSKPYQLAKNGHWEEAVAIWTKQAEDANHALAGRACFNLAFASERNKKFDEALKWAKRSLALGDPQAGNYVNALESRIENEQVLAAKQK
jgi:hypothetical protein